MDGFTAESVNDSEHLAPKKGDSEQLASIFWKSVLLIPLGGPPSPFDNLRFVSLPSCDSIGI